MLVTGSDEAKSRGKHEQRGHLRSFTFDQTVTETIVEKMEVAEELTPVEPITDNNNDSEDEVMSVVIDQDENKENATKDEENTDNAKDIDKDVLENPNPNAEEEIVVETLDEEVQGAVGGAAINDAEEKPSSDPKQIGAKRSFDHLSDNVSLLSPIISSLSIFPSDLRWWVFITKQSEEIRQPWTGLPVRDRDLGGPQ